MKERKRKQIMRAVSIVLAVLMAVGVLATSIPALMGF
jgi:hypothetical protein